MVHVTNNVGYHEYRGAIPCVHAYDKVSNLWQRTEFVECFHVRSCVSVDGCPPLGGGTWAILGLLGKNFHQVVLWSRTVGQCSRVNGMSIFLNSLALGQDLEEQHAEFGR